MKLKILLLFFLVSNTQLYANVDLVNDNDTRIVVANGNGCHTPHVCEPVVMYNMTLSTITVDFGTQPVNSFVVTISSLYTDVDYYATSSFTTIPLAVDGYSDYSITIATDQGDTFTGTFTVDEYFVGEIY